MLTTTNLWEQQKLICIIIVLAFCIAMHSTYIIIGSNSIANHLSRENVLTTTWSSNNILRKFIASTL